MSDAERESIKARAHSCANMRRQYLDRAQEQQDTANALRELADGCEERAQSHRDMAQTYMDELAKLEAQLRQP